MRVIGWSPHLTKDRANAAGVEFVESKEFLLKQSDILSIHMVLSDSTRHLIGAGDFSLMKSTAFFINTSRGPIVDEAALVDALETKKIAGAGLDVFDVEPLPLDHPLRKLKNVTLSPHNGYVNDSNYKVRLLSYECTICFQYVSQIFLGFLGSDCREYSFLPGWRTKEVALE